MTDLRTDGVAGSRWLSDRGTVAVGEMLAFLALVMIAVIAAITVLQVAGYDVGGWFGGLLGISN